MARKSKYQSREAKHEHRIKIIMSGVLLFLMLFSIFGIWATSSSQKDKIEYNGYSFKLVQDDEYGKNEVIITKVDGKEFFFYTLPQQSLLIPVEGNLTTFFKNKNNFIFTTTPNTDAASLSDLIRYEFSKLTGNEFYPAVDDVYEGFEDYVVIGCQNATHEFPVIKFIETNESTNMIVDENCLNINLNIKDAVYVRDRLLLSLSGIANE